jgi:hypothetical protein
MLNGNKMKISELLELWKGYYVDYEIYELFSITKGFHTDNLKDYISYCNTNLEVVGYELADEKDYNRTVTANTCEIADFKELYGDKNAKVLLIAVDTESYEKK